MITNKDIEDLKQKKCEKAFNRIYEKYHKLIFHIIHQIIKDYQASEDVLMETFYYLIKDVSQFRGGNFKYWLVTIAKNRANGYIRKTVNHRDREQKFSEIQDSNHQNDVSALEISNYLLVGIKEIVDHETYEIIFLHTVRELKFREIAKIQDKTLSAVANKYHRGMKKVKEILK